MSDVPGELFRMQKFAFYCKKWVQVSADIQEIYENVFQWKWHTLWLEDSTHLKFDHKTSWKI